MIKQLFNENAIAETHSFNSPASNRLHLKFIIKSTLSCNCGKWLMVVENLQAHPHQITQSFQFECQINVVDHNKITAQFTTSYRNYTWATATSYINYWNIFTLHEQTITLMW